MIVQAVCPRWSFLVWRGVVWYVCVCVVVVVEQQQQQQVLPTLAMMVIRTKQIIGLKLGSCFLPLPAAALLVH